jgi:hypothetical protein
MKDGCEEGMPANPIHTYAGEHEPGGGGGGMQVGADIEGGEDGWQPKPKKSVLNK